MDPRLYTSAIGLHARESSVNVYARLLDIYITVSHCWLRFLLCIYWKSSDTYVKKLSVLSRVTIITTTLLNSKHLIANSITTFRFISRRSWRKKTKIEKQKSFTKNLWFNFFSKRCWKPGLGLLVVWRRLGGAGEAETCFNYFPFFEHVCTNFMHHF